MSKRSNEESYQMGAVSVFNIRNRNETRAINLFSVVLKEFPDYEPSVLDIQDIYALTLNHIKPRYAQEFSIILNESITDDMIKFQLRKAIQKVHANPTN